MADVRDRVGAEMEIIKRTLKEIPAESRCAKLTPLELAGVAALLHNFYNGLENVLKQAVRSREVSLPLGDMWHRDLLALARTQGVIGAETLDLLRPYLAFRHFFAHGYALDLDFSRLQPLVEDVRRAFVAFEHDVQAFLES